MTQVTAGMQPVGVFGQKCPVEERRHRVEMLRVKPQERRLVICTGDVVCGVYTHWWSGSTWPCIGQSNCCVPCSNGSQWRWNGYIDVYDPNDRRQWVATITRDAYLGCSTMRERGKGFRGHYMTVARAGKRPNSPLSVVMGGKQHQHELPDSIDMVAFLTKLFGVKMRCEEHGSR